MWKVETFRPASGEARKGAETLRNLATRSELEHTRLPDFVSLSRTFGKLCLPFREHDVDSFAPYIYEVLRKRGERGLILFENPLYEETSQFIAMVDLEDNDEVRALIGEGFFSGGYIIGTVTPLFRWFGNFTDYGFMFTDASVIRDIFQAPPFTTYRAAREEFRQSTAGDFLLDREVSKLDEIWQPLGSDT